jgi:hypothetical protein
MAKTEIFEEYKAEYWQTSKTRKSQILTVVCEVTKRHRKAAIRKFRTLQLRQPNKVERRGRVVYYTPDVTAALKDVWEWSSEICGELLHSCLAEHIDILKRDQHWKHGDETTGKLLAMSERTMKRRVACFLKVRNGRGVSSTSPSLLKEIIPIFDGQWNEVAPGHGQIDTVVHCGASLLGDMAYSLNYTDVRTFWIVPRAQWNKGQEETRVNVEVVRDRLPFQLQSIHPDSGGEFINWHLKDWCDKNGIIMTRSRPNHKNDNAYVEQKNGHVIRRFLGYTRIDCREAVPVMNEFYRVLGLYLNHFIPSRKCVEKVRIGSKYRRKYDQAQTPYQRVLASPEVAVAVKVKLRQEHEMLNPLVLKQEWERLRAKIFKIQKDYGSQGQGKKDG